MAIQLPAALPVAGLTTAEALDFDLTLPGAQVIDAVDFDLTLPGGYTAASLDFDLTLPETLEQLTPPALITARLAASSSGVRDTASIVGGERWSARVEAYWP